jgi:hypothetical protein
MQDEESSVHDARELILIRTNTVNTLCRFRVGRTLKVTEAERKIMSKQTGNAEGSRACHGYVPHRGDDIPLDCQEQDDLFRQMTKWFGSDGLRDCKMMASEMENIFRMKATILQQRKTIDAGDTAITQLEQGNEVLQREKQELHEHFEKFAGFAATCRRENTYEWMLLMLDWLNGVTTRLDPDAYFDIVGAELFALRRTSRTVT